MLLKEKIMTTKALQRENAELRDLLSEMRDRIDAVLDEFDPDNETEEEENDED